MRPQGLAKHESDATGLTFEAALQRIAAQAAELDANPRFPLESFESLKAAGIPQLAGNRECCQLGKEIAIIRALAAADASTARILDGHFNGVERLALGVQGELRSRELQDVRQARLLLGVWGADPSPGEGPPAKIERSADGTVALSGVKTFCSGAGGVQRALVIARDEPGARRLVYVDVSNRVWIDRDWYRASGLRSSESHRVEFRKTPVLAILGEEEEILREPWFSRDSVRTAATWAGLADRILKETVTVLQQSAPDDVRLHAIGRMRVAQSAIDHWLRYSVTHLERAAAQVEAAKQGNGKHDEHDEQTPPSLETTGGMAAECRIALADAAKLIAAEAARVCGSRALVNGGALDRARRDLDLFLLQHRLDPKLVELGARTLEDKFR